MKLTNGGREDLDCEIAGSGADFEDNIGRLEGSFLDDCEGDTRVFEDVLAEPRVKFEDFILGGAGLLAVGRRAAGAGFAFLRFRHGGGFGGGGRCGG